MIELSVIFGLYVLVSGAIIIYLLKLGKEERQELEDRVMVLAKPDSAILHKAARDPEPAKVSYMDEEAEFALQEELGRPDMVGDED